MYRANNYLREYLTILKNIRNISPELSYVFVPHPQDDLSLKKGNH